MKLRLFLVAALVLSASSGLSQKRQEKPKLHADFHFGSYPVYRDAITTMAKEDVRLLMVGFHQNWDLEKIAKESKVPAENLDKLFADLEEGRLVVEIDLYSRRPLLPVIRDKDIERVQPDLETHIQEYTKVVRSNWPEIESAVASFEGAKGVPKPQLLYQIVVGGILFGGMNDAFFEDQRIMVPPPRRVGSQRYYGWLVESEPKLAGVLKREQWESAGYTLVSIGTVLPEFRMSLDRIRMDNGMVLEEAEARRFRSFVAILTKEKLLPYFKENRSAFMDVVNRFDAGRYVSRSEVFAWYYDQLANGVAEQLVAAGLIQPPTEQYAYALKSLAR
jgi:hypothetical protein